jgi:acetyltransferase-like isoleucine patch superfamily enzyme
MASDSALRSVALGLRSPRRAWSVGWEYLRGWWYKLSYPARGIRFSAGRRFRVSGRLIVRGPGTVRFGDNVRVGMTVTPWTHALEAAIDVGDDVYLNGTRFGCARSIRVGARCILADASIMDTDFHSTRADRHNPDAPVRVAPVILGENVWIAANVGILAGSCIGENSVVGFGSVVRGGTFPADVIIAGNPAKVEKPIPPSSAGSA